MFFVFDVIALAIFLITVVSCRSKGFLRSFLGMMKVVISIIIAYIFMPTVAYFFRTSFVEKLISENVADRINALAVKTASGFDLQKLFGDMPAEFVDILNRYGADTSALSERFGGISDAAEAQISELAGSISSTVVHAISDFLGFVTLFIGSMIVLTIVILIVGLITKLPVISSIDKGLGLVFGIISGLILVWIYCNLVSFGVEAIGIVKPGVLGGDVIENTYIIRYISENFRFGFASVQF